MPMPDPGTPALAATHDGPFHADDILAGAMLLAGYPGLAIVRTRDPVALQRADLRFDVGGAYDSSSLTFDHHFVDHPKRPNGVPYSSAGLIWRSLGGPLLARCGLPGPQRQTLHEAFDLSIVLSVDAADNGVSGAPFDPLIPALTSDTPPWNGAPREPAAAQLALDSAYSRQVERVAVRFREMVDAVRDGATAENSVRSFHAAVVTDGALGLAAQEVGKQLVSATLRNLIAAHEPREDPLDLEDSAMPWAFAIHQVEADLGQRVDQVLFRALDGTWIVQSVAVAPRSFVSRIPFPANWRGLNGDAFQEVSGLTDAVFCHPTGFCAGFGSRKSALVGAAVARRSGVGPRPENVDWDIRSRAES